MSYFPLFIDLENEKCLVIGGGQIAYRKINVLQEFGAKVTVIAEKFDDNIYALGNNINLIEASCSASEDLMKAYKCSDNEEYEISLSTFKVVVAATNDERFNHQIAEACKKMKILVNAVDQMDDCSFIFPSYYKAGKLTMGITTSGTSPYYAAKLREKFQVDVPDMTEDFLEQMAVVRNVVKEKIQDCGKRGKILKAMVLYAMEKNRILTEIEIKNFIEEEIDG